MPLARIAGALIALLLSIGAARAADEAGFRAWIDTFNPTAEKVYRRQGYTPFGKLPDFPAGRSRIFLQKKLP